uniref:Uncharacterized protein n=1 Tax=Nelumbo nucifera TaxID=4432 RepID=A0A822YD78_NELNU|nr:TPA_asm: hypothetical protein HUJ06_030484 [Nelumbo nucifera]
MNFTMQTNGTGLAQSFLMTFKADSALTNISFVSLTTSQTRDFVFCGPVIDNVLHLGSNHKCGVGCCFYAWFSSYMLYRLLRSRAKSESVFPLIIIYYCYFDIENLGKA